MKTIFARASQRKGSALLTVVFLSAIMALLTSSLLKYTINERRNNERQRMVLRARNMAENISVYAAEQITIKLMRLRSTTPRKFATGINEIHLPPDNVLTTSYSAPSDMEVRAGLTASTSYAYVNPAADPTNPNAGLHVSTSTVPVIAKASMTHPLLGTTTAYCEHTMEISMIPLFQFGIFYNMDLELYPGQAMTIAGPVHTNGKLMARGEGGGSATVTFTSRVTAALGLYANGQMKANYRSRTGSYTATAGGTGAVTYTSSSNTTASLLQGGIWKDHKFSANPDTASETTTSLNQFKNFATSTYTGYVRTNVHGVTPLELPSIGTYKETNDPDTDEDDRNNGRQLIEPRDPKRWVSIPPNTSPTWQTVADTADQIQEKFSGKAGLYIVVNPDDEFRTGKLPDGNNIGMIPHTYRCFLNTTNLNGSHTLYEVILPGQPSYGYSDSGTPANTADDVMYRNNLPNRYATNTIVVSNQVLRIGEPAAARTWDDRDAAVAGDNPGYANNIAATLATFPDGVFYDLRRATNWNGYPYNRATNSYTPRPIAKIDFDMTRFKMCVDRTMSATPLTVQSTATSTTGYHVGQPVAGYWANSIYNSAATTMSLLHGVGAGYAVYPASTDAATKVRQDPFRMYFAPANPLAANVTADPSVYGVGATSLYSVSGPTPWFDGITVYIHSVDAEVRAQTAGVPNRIDSGVRLWNGRGTVATLTAQTGLSLVTNDALYIVGHFNSDGSISGAPSTTADSANEKLTAVMADAITLLSQPTFTVSSGNYYQVAGWNDALSAHAPDNGTELTRHTSWRITNPGSSNEVEGEGANKKPGNMPHLSTASTSGVSGYPNPNEKLPTVHTEISAALLMGLVPSNHNATDLSDRPPIAAANQQYSGGAHNFPRLLEDWHNQYNNTSANSTLAIRGSMVALFESRVAMEPWNIRAYLAPTRVWGLHSGFAASGHHVPLEPIVLSSRRMRYKELTAAEYATWQATIQALPD